VIYFGRSNIKVVKFICTIDHQFLLGFSIFIFIFAGLFRFIYIIFNFSSHTIRWIHTKVNIIFPGPLFFKRFILLLFPKLQTHWQINARMVRVNWGYGSGWFGTLTWLGLNFGQTRKEVGELVFKVWYFNGENLAFFQTPGNWKNGWDLTLPSALFGQNLVTSTTGIGLVPTFPPFTLWITCFTTQDFYRVSPR